VLAGLWLFCVPALFAGVIEVLAPLRLDELGASGVAVGAVFLVMAAVEAVVSPIAGRLSDRRGRLAPIRIGLAGAVGAAVLLPLPETPLLLALVLVVAVVALGTFWAPAMALLSDASDAAGVEQGLAFGLANLAWAGGILAGGAGGAALADATSDALAYGLIGSACLLTLAALARRRRVRAAAV
jgi:MFS family permease